MEVEKGNIIDFFQTQIIFWYGVPWYIITDKDKPFVNKLMISHYEKFKFAKHKSSMYNGSTNGLAEPFNKILCDLL